MNGFEKLLELLDGKMETPTAFGWFHILSILVVIGLIVTVVFTCRNLSNKTFKIITITTASVMLLLEVYKQFNYSYNPANGEWSYQWYAFPFQFCSTPMYVLLLAGLVKPGKFQDFLCSFLATFGLFAGLIVMILPGDVFIKTIGINIQTMVHHGLMIVIGVFMYVSGRAKLEHKTILKGAAVFGVLIVAAFLMNVLFHYTGDIENHDFNMFYIGPYIPTHLIILSDIYAINYYLFLASYLFGFTLAGYIMLLIAMLISFITKKIKQSKAKKQLTKQVE